MDNLPVPLSRVESYLAKACGMDVITPEPGPGIEQFLYAIAYNTTPPVAGYRTEEWLAYVQGVTPAKPLELEGSCIIGNQKVDVKYFAVAAGMPGATLPEKPQNRKEKYWEYIATHRPTPGVLKYATGTNITLTDVVRGIEELQFVYGDTTQQTYSGKNLFNWPALIESTGDYANATLNEWGASGVTITGNTSTSTSEFATSKGIFKPTASNTNQAYQITVPDNSTITISADVTMLETGYTPRTQIILDPGGSLGGGIDLTLNQKIRVSHTFTNVAAGTYRPVFSLNSCKLKIENIQFEIGQPTSYEPYVGGIPSPNPDYPQAVQTVTGEQTVTISDGVESEVFPISLGSTELAKIGNYQDYIYKSGDDWYVHKACGKVVLDGSSDEEWVVTNSGQANFFYRYRFINYNTSSPLGVSNNFVYADIVNATTNPGFMLVNNNQVRFRPNFAELSIDEWRVWLSTHNTTVYYPLATPTDTQITDATLIGQLNAIDSAVLPKPIAYITVGATDPNLPGPLKISYYGEEE